MTKTWSGPIYNKTALAHEELATRSHGLSPRLRQLLILIDGQRSEEQLVRLIPRAEFDEYLPVLEAGGFIVRKDADPGPTTTMIAPATTIIGAQPAADPAPPAPEAPVTAEPPAAVARAGHDAGAEPDGAVQLEPTAADHAGSAPPDENAEMRERLIAALRDVIGEQGNELAERIERCGSRRELRDLMPAALSIVEIIGGRKALQKFQEQAGLRSS